MMDILHASLLRGTMLPCLLALAGCATVPTTRLVHAPLHYPLKLAAVQAPMAVDAGRLQEVVAADDKQRLSLADPPLARAVQHAQARAAAAMAARLRAEPELSFVPYGRSGEGAPLAGQDLDAAITPDEAARLRAATGAEALLRYRVTDYGLTPRAWRTSYIAFEVATTAAVAAVIAYAGSNAAKAAAGAYLVQETAEETASAYAGFQLLDAAARPVRIEAELVGLDPSTLDARGRPAVLWQTQRTGFSDIGLGRYFRAVGAAERARQLDEATDDAARSVAADLHAALEYDRRMRMLGR